MGAGDPADLIGKTDHDFYRAEVADAFSADDRLVIEQGISIVNKEEPNTSALGELRWILTTKVPLRDETGAIIGLVGTGHDITGRKMAEHKSREQATLLDIVPDAIFVRRHGPQDPVLEQGGGEDLRLDPGGGARDGTRSRCCSPRPTPRSRWKRFAGHGRSGSGRGISTRSRRTVAPLSSRPAGSSCGTRRDSRRESSW